MVSFWLSNRTLTNQTLTTQLFNFEISHIITVKVAFHAVQLPLSLTIHSVQSGLKLDYRCPSRSRNFLQVGLNEAFSYILIPALLCKAWWIFSLVVHFQLTILSLMCHAFERLRVIREYRSPRTIRSFTKVFIFLMPIVLSPYYVHMGIKSGNTWSPYYIAVLTSFIFGTLQGVQDVLDDPFDGISEDDINLGPVRKSVQVF